MAQLRFVSDDFFAIISLIVDDVLGSNKVHAVREAKKQTKLDKFHTKYKPSSFFCSQIVESRAALGY
jgi:hypothetical protein